VQLYLATPGEVTQAISAMYRAVGRRASGGVHRGTSPAGAQRIDVDAGTGEPPSSGW
jgi:hypothetical protein